MRLGAGAAASGILLAAVVVEVARTGESLNVRETLRGADVVILGAAAAAEAWRYVLSGALLRLLTGFGYALSIRISTAAITLGALVPGSQLPGGGIAFRELLRRGVPRRRALAVSTALVLVVPAASLALLSGPALLIAGTQSDLPASWRAILDLLGIAALMLAAAILLVVAVGRRAHHAPASLGFGICAWIADGVGLWLTAHALGIGVDPAVIPLACLAAAAIMAIPVVPAGLGVVEAAVPFILATTSTSYAEAALVVLVWRLLSFWMPTAAGAGAFATLHRRPSPGVRPAAPA
jgi:putative heme transporter